MTTPSIDLPQTEQEMTQQPRARQTMNRTRIQYQNEKKILDAALQVFSQYGWHGTTVKLIAAQADMSTPNVLYYFRRKRDIYLAVLERTLDKWLESLQELDVAGDPEQELRAYILRKLKFSRDHPLESRLFASEILQGATILKPVLETRLRKLVESKTAGIEAWIANGKIAPIDPYHLIFMLWATTQHYADFAPQIEAVLAGSPEQSEEPTMQAEATLLTIFLRGLRPDIPKL